MNLSPRFSYNLLIYNYYYFLFKIHAAALLATGITVIIIVLILFGVSKLVCKFWNSIPLTLFFPFPVYFSTYMILVSAKFFRNTHALQLE